MSLVWISWSLRMVGGMICMKYADTREIPYEWFVISSTLSIDLLKLSLPWILNNTANVIVVPIIVLVIVISSAICPPMYYRRANSLLRLMENMLSQELGSTATSVTAFYHCGIWSTVPCGNIRKSETVINRYHERKCWQVPRWNEKIFSTKFKPPGQLPLWSRKNGLYIDKIIVIIPRVLRS